MDDAVTEGRVYSPSLRPFWLVRDTDVSGISGTGVVAEGVEFSSGVVALTWLSAWPTSVVFHDRGDPRAQRRYAHRVRPTGRVRLLREPGVLLRAWPRGQVRREGCTMSTCIGAPAPHNDCPHGQNCDWGREAHFTRIETLTFPVLYVASCSCGWRGCGNADVYAAQRDALAHETTPARNDR